MSLNLRHLKITAVATAMLISPRAFAADTQVSCEDIHAQAQVLCSPETADIAKAPTVVKEELLQTRLKQVQLLKELDANTATESISETCNITAEMGSKFAQFHKSIAERCEKIINRCSQVCGESAASDDKAKKDECLGAFAQKAVANLKRSESYASTQTTANACVESVRQLSAGGSKIIGSELAGKIATPPPQAVVSTPPSVKAATLPPPRQPASTKSTLTPSSSVIPYRDEQKERRVKESEVLQTAITSTLTAHPELKSDYEKIKWIYDGVVKKELGVSAAKDLSDSEFSIGMQLAIQNSRIRTTDFLDSVRSTPTLYGELYKSYQAEAQRLPASAQK